ncbi:MAG: DUF2357 domain-containing protein [Bacteroidales bacterium]|nr:DUF2357 domain-containing protein [Bacteroidales bacterium]MBQ8959539.1 DUF2357 domain-containing protein [Bacteroidales bacterium]
MTEYLKIPVANSKDDLMLMVYPQSSKAMVFEENDLSSGESKWQLVEGEEYEYEFTPNGYSFLANELVCPSKSNASRGLIKTGVYIGCLTLKVVDRAENEIADVNFEVRSVKMDYRTDYKSMLHDITCHFTELVMMQGAPITQRFEVNPNEKSRTLYQQFAFMKSLIDSEEFEEALNKILYNPIHKWTGTIIEKDICAVKRLGRQELRQIVSSKNRLPLDEGEFIGDHIGSVPRRLSVSYKKDTVDVAENRFVKLVLQSFSSFCSTIQQCKNASPRLKTEAELTANKLMGWLSRSFFLDVSNLQTLTLNSPALQRKEGYREVLQAWMMSKLAAQITWKGGDNVYQAGKRNVAALYEYWVFFKLLDIVKETFRLELTEEDEKKLVKTDNDHINLELKQGHTKMIGGVYRIPTRILKVRLYYNRTFGMTDKIDASGSWTTAMRPDYTLSIWPGNIKETEAEEQDLIVHIHFDAKYKLNRILINEKEHEETHTVEDDDTDLSEEDLLMIHEKQEEEKGIFKRVDLLKMHAYKDAIRRTSGAYILYPGSENKRLKGFHEVLPGLGAFCLSPNSVEKDSKEIERFLHDILEHMMNRASQRERMSYHTYEIYKNEPSIVSESMPEPYGSNRDLIPEETYVLLGSFRNESHLKWILKNHIYNTRTDSGNGSIRLKYEISSAKYVLLHNGGTQIMLRLSPKGPRVMSKERLCDLDRNSPYKPSLPYYVVFDLVGTEPEEEYQNAQWDFNKMINEGIIKKGHLSAEPKGISLAELMRYKKKN